MLYIVFSTVYCRIDGAADGLVQADAVSRTADVAGNTAAKITFVSIFNLVDPFRLRDQAASHANKICIPLRKDFLRDLWMTDISDSNAGFPEFFLHSSCHIRTPAVREIICIYLVLDGTIQATGNIKDIHFFFQVFQISQGVLQCISALHKLIRADAQENREMRPDLFSNCLQDHMRKAGTVFSGTAKFICPFVVDRRKELADQVGMARMDLDCVKATNLCTSGSFCIFTDNMQDFFLCQRPRDFTTFLRRHI